MNWWRKPTNPVRLQNDNFGYDMTCEDSDFETCVSTYRRILFKNLYLNDLVSGKKF